MPPVKYIQKNTALSGIFSLYKLVISQFVSPAGIEPTSRA